MEGRAERGQGRREERPLCHRAEGRGRKTKSRCRFRAADHRSDRARTARRHAARRARWQAARRARARRARADRPGGPARAGLGYTEAVDQVVFLNGEYLPLAEAKVPVLDRGFIFGDGVYEVVPVYSKVAFRLDEHLARLERSLGEAKIRNPYSRQRWREIIYQLVDAQPFEDQGVYFQVTRGVAKRDHAFPRDAQPTVFMMANPLVNPPRAQVEAGGAAVSAQDNRWLRCDIKSIS